MTKQSDDQFPDYVMHVALWGAKRPRLVRMRVSESVRRGANRLVFDGLVDLGAAAEDLDLNLNQIREILRLAVADVTGVSSELPVFHDGAGRRIW